MGRYADGTLDGDDLHAVLRRLFDLARRQAGKGVIVRPDTTANPVSRDQLCVRGRFGYDAIKNTQRLQTPLIRRNGGQDAATWDEALEFTVARLAQVREEHGPDAIGFLGSPLATNEENYLAQQDRPRDRRHQQRRFQHRPGRARRRRSPPRGVRQRSAARRHDTPREVEDAPRRRP